MENRSRSVAIKRRPNSGALFLKDAMRYRQSMSRPTGVHGICLIVRKMKEMVAGVVAHTSQNVYHQKTMIWYLLSQDLNGAWRTAVAQGVEHPLLQAGRSARQSLQLPNSLIAKLDYAPFDCFHELGFGIQADSAPPFK